MIKVCDAIMGTGKTQAAIAYMNAHPDDKFIYITPYLDEAARIKDNCPELHFVEPSDKIKEYRFSKSRHAVALIDQGRNIATTHQAFKYYTEETLEQISQKGYTLIVDENVDVLEECTCSRGDLELLVTAGCVVDNDGLYSIGDKEYSGSAFTEMFTLLKTRDLMRFDAEDDTLNTHNLFYWTLPPRLFTSFSNVFILTYLFEGQGLYKLFQMYDIDYEYIGIEKTQDGGFRFGTYPGYVPEYVAKLSEVIRICDNKYLNKVGEKRTALSSTWFKDSRHADDIEQLKKNISNYFNTINREIPALKRLWSTFKDKQHKLKGKGYTNSFLPFSTKAVNEYRDRTVLVYAVNIFLNPFEVQFYRKRGVEAINEDLYALSTMVQWIWRSSIRDGHPVDIYIPSSRMRELLTDWINTEQRRAASEASIISSATQSVATDY